MGNSTLPLGGGDARRISEVVVQTAHGFSAGEVVRHNGTQFVLAQADSAANAEAVGIIESATLNDFEVVYQGRIDISGLGLGTNEVWFLDDSTAGALTLTPPSTAGSVIKAMLVTADAADGFVTGYIGVQIGGDNTVSLDEIQPVGTILPWAAGAATPVPTGWLLCVGQDVSRPIAAGGTTDDYEDLWNLIGVDYGNGDGSTTFTIPNLIGRVPVGQNAAGGPFDPFLVHGNTGGSIDHTLSDVFGEIPDHTHDLDVLPVFDPGAGTPYNAVVDTGGTPTPLGPKSGSSGNPHNNLQPYLTVNFIIRYTAQASAGLLDHDLSQHSDVDVPASPDTTTPDQYVLTFNSTAQKWEAGPRRSSEILSFRNMLINGNFDIWQRGTTFSPSPVINGDFGPDRWNLSRNINVSGGTFTGGVLQRGTLTPGQLGEPLNARYYCDFAGTQTGGDGREVCGLRQRVENVETYSDGPVTVSFWAKGSIAGTIYSNIARGFGTGGSTRDTSNTEAINLTTSWQFFSFVLNVPSVVGKTIVRVDDYLSLRFLTQGGPANLQNLPTFTYTGTVSLAAVQMEIGSLATPFEKRPREVEWGMCQRYYQQTYDETVPAGTPTPIGSWIIDNNLPGYPQENSVEFDSRMRVPPSINFYGGLSGLPGLADNFVGPATMPVLIVGVGEHSFHASYIFAPIALAWTVHWTADAEL